MKLLKRNIITIQEVEKLIEKYYEGETSVAEEQQIREFLAGKNVPAQFEAEKAIFGYFESEKQKKPVRFTPNFLKWSAVASVVAVAVFIAVLFTNQPVSTGYAYVDGRKITNKEVIRSLALTTVSQLATANNELEVGLENIQPNEVIERQLDAFAGIEF